MGEQRIRPTNTPRRFALLGLAGYIAERHLRAIQSVGGELVAAADPNDSVGKIDRYFPKASFFTEVERFDRHLERLRRKGEGVDYVVICSPNYLHDAHIRLALRLHADAICEKPVVIKPHNLDALQEFEAEFNHRVWAVLQLRLHPAVQKLKTNVGLGHHHVQLTYHTPRGTWYHYSWKGDSEKSGGLAMNIGVHFFDMLTWVFGPAQHVEVRESNRETVEGTLILERASVDWHLSIALGDRQRTMLVDDQSVEFTDGFEDLHAEVYRRILAGQGFGLEECRASIRLANKIASLHP
ncbi:MAG: Gfo/Idh/MocA family oxidoreductase [Candidatus Kerfeldbacteria bacterium]|nr:Gfo/Idh/MocA family oxidoreductase [Candidatus Kerfeldbacteria bacterium]